MTATATSMTAAATSATAATSASDKLNACRDRRVFLVEHIERRQADVGDFFLTQREFVARIDMPRRDIRGGPGRLRGCAGQRQQSNGP
jgi:hypothetical protein